MADDASLTPSRRQYLELKARHPGAILLFRMGDFYETFDADAEIVARELDIALTSRPMGKQGRVPLAGVPYHALDGYLAKLITRGYRVAICEQLADPKDVKGIVPRGVVRVVSPGTVMEPELLQSERNNYLAAYRPPDRQGAPAAVAYIDITTSEFAVAELPEERALAELERLGAAELLVPAGDPKLPGSPAPVADDSGRSSPVGPLALDSGFGNAIVTAVSEGSFDPERGRETLLEHFRVATLEAFGCERLPAATGAAAAIVGYLRDNQPAALPQVTRLLTYSVDAWMQLDRQTMRNLELLARAREETGQGSLFSVLDLTRSPMGGRLLRRWLCQPLVELAALEERLDAVAWLVDRPSARSGALAALGRFQDLERLLNRVRGGRAGPRDLLALLRSLELLPQLAALMQGAPDALVSGLGVPAGAALAYKEEEPPPSSGGLSEVCALIRTAINEDAPASLDEGEVMRAGFSPELDGLRQRVRAGQEAIAGLERRERDRTGIKSLKVGFNKVFGYYLEVSNAHRRLVPPDYLRKQTLVGAERFFTEELKAQETAVLASQDRIGEVEQDLFRRVCVQVTSYGEQVLSAAATLARVDVHAAFAEAAARYRYVRPVLNTGHELRIIEGRHPAVERQLAGGAFVPNDTLLGSGPGRNEARGTRKDDGAFPQIALITGPNMSGKSTYLRQVALIVLMAQIGSFVPAREATIGLADRIFSRIGAQDDLATGQSTFMVEMAETAHILHHATTRSLVILDELGRGTSTYDGISIAQSVVEYLHQNPDLAPKTLFATHYHELTALSRSLPRVKNFTFAVTEEGGDLVFLRRLLPGASDQSYGVHVARLAGLPHAVTRRAEDLLQAMEGMGPQPAAPRRRDAPALQMPLWNGHAEVVDALRALDLNAMTPLEALTTIYRLQSMLKGPDPGLPSP